MFSTVFNSQAVYVVDDFWDGGSSLKADFAIVRDDQASLTKRETSRAFSQTLRVQKLQYTATVLNAALRKLQGALRDITTENVIIPFWPAMTRWADRASASISGGLKIAWKDDWSQFEIYTNVEPVWPTADDNFAPAVFGFLKPTEPDILNPDSAFWNINFVESSPAAYALAPAAFALTPGPQPAGYAAAPSLLPFQPDFNDVTEKIGVDVKREQFGFNRELSQTFYPQASSRTQKASYTLTAGQIGQFLNFFQNVSGTGAAFWASGWTQVASLKQDVAATDSVLTVEDTNAVKVGDYISIYNAPTITPRKISAKTGNTITLDSAAGAAFPAALSCVFPLCLSRLDKSVVTLSWINTETATASLSWRELPAELLPAGDETLGTTLGALPTRVILFHLWRDYGNGTVDHWYFTNFEQDVTWSGHTWSYRDISCGDISRGLNLEDDGCDITSGKFTGNPIIEDFAKRAETQLQATIYFSDFVASTIQNVETVFSGFVSGVSREGNKLRAKCKFGPPVLDNPMPLFLFGTSCNHLRGNNPDGSYLISPGCTLLKANWKFTAQVGGPLSALYPFTLYLTGLARSVGAAPTYFANWFAGGVIEWGAGANLQRRSITASTTPVAGALSVSLHRYFKTVPNIGDTVTLYPGCDGSYLTCKAYDATTNPLGKFNNFDNHFATPFMPVGNPSLVGQPNVNMRGGKK